MYDITHLLVMFLREMLKINLFIYLQTIQLNNLEKLHFDGYANLIKGRLYYKIRDRIKPTVICVLLSLPFS